MIQRRFSPISKQCICVLFSCPRLAVSLAVGHKTVSQLQLQALQISDDYLNLPCVGQQPENGGAECKYKAVKITVRGMRGFFTVLFYILRFFNPGFRCLELVMVLLAGKQTWSTINFLSRSWVVLMLLFGYLCLMIPYITKQRGRGR